MLKKLRTSFLVPAELGEIIGKYIIVVLAMGTVDPFIMRIIRLLQEDEMNIKGALAVVKNAKIKAVSEADSIREDLFVGLRNNIDSSKRRKSEEVRNAQSIIWPIFESIGLQIYRLGYVEQSGKMDALIAELDKEENQIHLQTLNVIDAYNELKEAQQEFDSLTNERESVDIENQYPTVDEAKSMAVPHVNYLLSSINTLSETAEGTEVKPVADLIDKLNVITSDIMATARARKTRKDNGRTEDENDDSDNDSTENDGFNSDASRDSEDIS